MNDLISRQAAVDEALMFFVEYLGGAFDEDSQMLLAQRMNSIPSAEKVHGEWVNEWKGIDGGRMYGACCSVCHALGHSGYNFCPNCGAKMDKGED